MLEADKQFGHYKIRSQLGAGGMGEVFLAEDSRLHRQVALKVLPENIVADSDRLLRFEREAFAASALNHPNILTIFEFGAAGETHFLAAEFVKGETLRAGIERDRLTLSETLDITIQIASALQAAHQAGIIHRDIKPENVMIREDGYVKVLDFGLAKLARDTALDVEAETRMQAQTQAGMILGTAAYMSPEQARGRQVDARTDIFSLGVVLYEMLARRQPFTGETINHTIVAILEKEPPPLSQSGKTFPAEVERIVLKTLAKDKENRYESVKDLLTDLKSLQKRLEFEAELERTSSPNKRAEAPTQIIKVATTAETGTRNSIAVLPFENMSADAENEYFCDGLAEELLNALAKIDDLKVAARTSAFSFKGKNTNISEIGQALNVKTILEGSVRKSSNKLRITVQLINAADGYHLWSERYDREMQDIFDVQDEITLAVVDALKVKLFGDEKADLLKRYTDNTEAYEFYLKGLYQSNKYSPEDWRRAIEYFDKAIEIEPRYAAAYARKSYCQHYFYYYAVAAPDEIVDQWRATTEKALELDDEATDAHLSSAKFHFYRRRDWAKAEQEFKRAIELNTNSADARQFYGMFLASRGRMNEAVREGEIALVLDPLSLPANLHVAWIYWSSDRFDDSRRQARRMLEIEPNFFGAYFHKGMGDLGQGDTKAAVEAFQKAAALGATTYTLSYLGWAYALAGQREEALTIISELLEAKKREFTPAINIARVYAGLSETDETYEWLEKALDEHNGELVYLEAISKTGEGLFWGKDFRADSRFQDLMRRINSPKDSNGKTTNEASEAQTAMLSLGGSDQIANSRRIKNHKPFFIVSAIIFLLAAISFSYWFFSNRSSKQIESIAVLPFENASGNADLDYLSDGVSESVIDRLSQLPQLKVIARSSSFRYRGQNLNLPEIADKLGVDAIITGRVVPRGDSYQIRVELVDARDNKQLWGETFNRKASDVQILQTDISREIAENLRRRLSGTHTQQLADQGTTNPQAYELRLKGRYYFNKFGSPEDFHKSVEYYEQALAIDPNYAPAWAELSESYSFGGGRGLNGDERRSKQEASARKALGLDPNLAEAHFALANIKRNGWEWEEAEREYRRAIELNPSLSGPHGAYAALLSTLKRFDEAIAEIKRRNELDPLSILGSAAAGDVYFRARQYDEAIRFYMKMLELDHASPDARQRLGDVYAAQGKYAEAIAEYQKALTLRAGNDDTNIEALLAAVYVKAGKRDKSEEILKKLKVAGKGVQPRIMAILYAALGDHDEAFTQLEKAFAVRAGSLSRIATEPYYDDLRADPRFQDLLRRMNLPTQ